MSELTAKNFLGYVYQFLKHVDWLLFSCAIMISLAGLFTMNSFSPSNLSILDERFFERQSLWLIISVFVFFVSSGIDWSFLRKTRVIVILFAFSVFILSLLFVLGSVFKGAQSWFSFGSFSFQPTDVVKLIVILILAKYFSRRHVEIANIRHILVSGSYVSIIFLLVFMQPDFGSSIIIFLLWLGMVLVSGISKRHLFVVFAMGFLIFGLLWFFTFKPYQKDRIINFINPLTDIRGSGYNAYQSMIAVGSGQIVGKGIGYGTQSKLKFLPEYETDFIFAAFAEEWGLVGVFLLFILYGILLWRILFIASRGGGNFETLFGMGLAILFSVHIVVHVGMNIGLLPVTGSTLPFMSYGGSHLLAEFFGLGVLMGMRKSERAVHRSQAMNEMVGI